MGAFDSSDSAATTLWLKPITAGVNGQNPFALAPQNSNTASAGPVEAAGDPPANNNQTSPEMIAASLGMGDFLGEGDPATYGASAPAAPAAKSGSAIPREVLDRVGFVFDHDGGYSYRITAAGYFEIVTAPEDRGVGYELTPSGEFASAWKTLADYIVDMGPAEGAPSDGAPSDEAPTHGKPPQESPWHGGPAPGQPGGTPKAPSDEPEAPKEEPGGQKPGKGQPGEEPKAPGSGGLPYTVGGYPSSRPPGDRYPEYTGSEVKTQLPGLPLDDGDEKLTPPIVRAAQHVGSYLPDGTELTSGWRTDKDQADVIIYYAGGDLIDGDLAETYRVATEVKGNLIAWVGESPHRPGLAFDLSHASLPAIESAVQECKSEHPEDGIRGTTLESVNGCVHVDVDP